MSKCPARKRSRVYVHGSKHNLTGAESKFSFPFELWLRVKLISWHQSSLQPLHFRGQKAKRVSRAGYQLYPVSVCIGQNPNNNELFFIETCSDSFCLLPLKRTSVSLERIDTYQQQVRQNQSRRKRRKKHQVYLWQGVTSTWYMTQLHFCDRAYFI